MSTIRNAIILAGGRGTRLAEQTHSIPKPLVKVGGKPILVHIINKLVSEGVENIVIAGGYKVELIKEYFLSNEFVFAGDLNFTEDGKPIPHQSSPFARGLNNLIVADTGLNTNTAQRIKLATDYLEEGEDFYMIYGDNVSDVDLSQVAKKLHNSSSLAVLTAVRYQERFGIIHVDKNNTVTKFAEKSMSQNEFINGGFMACSGKLRDYILDTDGDFSKDTLPRLQNEGLLGAHVHDGFWDAMDTQRDYEQLNKLYDERPELFGD